MVPRLSGFVLQHFNLLVHFDSGQNILTLIFNLDVNECTLGTHTCKKDSEMCRNIHGSYRCICRRGFLKKNGRCEGR